jgi:uncharacterized protein
MSNEEKEALVDYVKNNVAVETDGIHGSSHWQRVEKIGRYLAEKNGADPEVVTLFAYFHDLGRKNNDADLEHGARSAAAVTELYNKKLLQITPEQFKKLVDACTYHSVTAAQSDDITIRTCWDADRLDLWRDGIEPNPQYLFTEEAKKPATILWAKELLASEK